VKPKMARSGEDGRNLDKIAKGLGAECRGEVHACSGHFGATQLVAEVQARFRTPAGGGRSTDPSLTEKRLVSLAPETLQRLEHLAVVMSEQGVTVGPLQIAALLLEHAVADADAATVGHLTRRRTG
jgi:hypothetical protein